MKFKNKKCSTLALMVLTCFNSYTYAKNCNQTLSSGDDLVFNTQALSFSKKCQTITINIKNRSNLPDHAMSHGLVVARQQDFDRVKMLINRDEKAGFLPESELILARTKMLSGTMKAKISLKVTEEKLETSHQNKKEAKAKQVSNEDSLVFFCPFPGHAEISKGQIVFE